MSQRLGDATKWFIILVIFASPTWNPVQCVTVKVAPKTPSTIEAQAKFFQDFFSVQLSPHNLEFGHVCEDPDTWEQRYEKKDFKNHRDMGKVRWGDKKGGYGEHYWDLNHAGHTGDHDNGYESNSDDGSYREEHNNDVYEEPSSYPTYGDGYDPEKASLSDDINRTKRAHPRSRNAKKTHRDYSEDDDNERTTQTKRKRVEQNKSDTPNDQNLYRKTVTAKHKNNYDNNDDDRDEDDDDTEDYEPESEEDDKDRKQVVLVLSKKEKGDYKDTPNQHTTTDNHNNFPPQNTQQLSHQNTQLNTQPQQYQSSQFAAQNSQQFNPAAPQQFPQPNQQSYLPYEGGAGLRQHQQPEASASAAVPRLFLEPSTGHIIDRTTGRAYVLQPLSPNYE